MTDREKLEKTLSEIGCPYTLWIGNDARCYEPPSGPFKKLAWTFINVESYGKTQGSTICFMFGEDDKFLAIRDTYRGDADFLV